MTYTNTLTTGTIILTCLAVLACKKTDTELTTGQWKVESITLQGSTTSQNATDTYVLEFKDKNDFSLRLDVNTCVGEYKIPKNGKITIDHPACTKVCCDSGFAEQVQNLLSKMTDYSINGTTLTLNGDGQIILSRQ